MSVRKHAGKRATTWHVVLELGRDPVSGKRLQRRISRDPETGRPMLTKKRAQEVEREELVKRHRGGVTVDETTTLGAYLERWLAETQETRAESTHYNWCQIVRTRITPKLGDIPLSRLNALELQAFYRGQAAHYAGSTVETTRSVLVGALKAAVRWRLLEHNPHEGVRLPRTIIPERAIWTADEVRLFLSKADGTRWGALWRLLFDSSMRIGEALALTWADIDLTAGTVRISKGVSIVASGALAVVPRTKSAAGQRTLSLAPATVDALRQHRAKQNERRLQLGEYWIDRNLVFDRDDGELVNNALVRRYFDRDIKAVGVSRITLHSLRHTSLTLAAAAGEPLHALMKRAGHSNIGITASLYAHHNQEADRRVSEALARVLEG